MPKKKELEEDGGRDDDKTVKGTRHRCSELRSSGICREYCFRKERGGKGGEMGVEECVRRELRGPC